MASTYPSGKGGGGGDCSTWMKFGLPVVKLGKRGGKKKKGGGGGGGGGGGEREEEEEEKVRLKRSST